MVGRSKIIVSSFLVFAVLTSAKTTQAQIIVGPDSCPPGYEFVPPDDCVEKEETKPDPVIIIPGILTSFNVKVLLLDQDNNNWTFFPVVGNVYRGLIERFEVAGYELGKTLFIAHYDWRQPNAESMIEYLIPMIEQAKQASGQDKVDIVAHSMGGLIARQYIRSAQYDNDVDQLITLGTPHEGASDAYIAWEGGDLPTRWGRGVQVYIELVELALKHTRDINLERPLSIRSFFPSLRDLLPIYEFAQRDGSDFPTESLTEENTFLKQLQADFNLIEQRGVKLTTIAGNDVNTLQGIALSADRSSEDTTLDRWRDGHPDPDPPLPDTTNGDQTVPLRSANLGSDITTLSAVPHDKIPEEAQELVLQKLGVGAPGPHLAYDLPNSVIGTVVLSPVDPVVSGPNGEVLSKDSNTFTSADFVWDVNDPQGPKLLTISNPPPGEYLITLTGIGSGPFNVITAFADAAGDTVDEENGMTKPSQVTQYSFVVKDSTSEIKLNIIDPRDLLKEISKLAYQAQGEHLIKGFERANITRPVQHALNDLKTYYHRLEKGRQESANQRLKSYYENLTSIDKGIKGINKIKGREELTEQLRSLLEQLRLISPPL